MSFSHQIRSISQKTTFLRNKILTSEKNPFLGENLGFNKINNLRVSLLTLYMPFGLNGSSAPAPMTWKKGEEEGKGKMQAWGWWICR